MPAARLLVMSDSQDVSWVEPKYLDLPKHWADLDQNCLTPIAFQIILKMLIL